MALPQQHEEWRVVRDALRQIRDEENAKETPDPILSAIAALMADIVEKYDLDDLEPAIEHIVDIAYRVTYRVNTRYTDEQEDGVAREV